MDKAPKSNKPEAPAHDQAGDCAALLIIDMINVFDFPGAEALRPKAKAAARAILALRDQADEARIPVIYVNDNFGEWHSERSRLVERASDRLVAPDLVPRESDYFVIKPQFSGFYSTNLPVLLPKLGATRLVLTGIATDICVTATAREAIDLGYRVAIASDASATFERKDANCWAADAHAAALAALAVSGAQVASAHALVADLCA